MLTSFLALVFGLVALAPAAQPHVPDPPPLIAPYDVVRIADGVYGFMWRDPLADPIQGNALFIINDRDVVVVDTALLPSTARVMAAELRKLTTKPVSYVINTHWHDDHHGGNAVYRELWPEVRIVGHQRDPQRHHREDLRGPPEDAVGHARHGGAVRALGGHR